MTIFAKITRTRTLFGLSLLISSSTSFAATFNFYIMNSSDSIVNPITITSGYIDTWSDDPTCPPKQKVLPKIEVIKGQEQIISYDPEYPTSCYSPYNPMVSVYAKLTITTVDGKITHSSSCTLWPYTENFNENVYGGTLRITEMSDRFLCEQLVNDFGVAKRK